LSANTEYAVLFSVNEEAGTLRIRRFENNVDVYDGGTGIYNSNMRGEDTTFYIQSAKAAGTASGLNPANGQTDVPRDGLVLEWSPGEFAASHDIYFGTDFEDVNTATLDSSEFKGNQSETTYALDRLEFSKSYFWRIDEVNETDPNSPWKGDVWSFEVEPEGILVNGLTATASSQNSPEEDPNNTINGVGLNPDGSHSTLKETMWLSAKSDPSPWIRYDLSEPQKLFEMLVWNHNSVFEEDLGYGIMEAQISVSLDGENFTDLGNVTLAQSAETAVDLQGVFAQSVKITVVSNYSGGPKSGLSEVRLYTIPVVAREVSPADGTADVNPATAVLSWRAGREAGAHNLYLGTDEQAVIDGTAAMITVPAASTTPNLELGKTYYWRVDEVNNVEDPTVWVGSVQSFSTAGSIPVDNMESYKNQAGLYIFEAWVDGYQINDNGSLVGVGANFEAEKTIVYEGSQSLPMTYGDLGIKDSWATLTLPTSNWNKYGIKSLSLYFRGSSTNTAGQLYVKINNTKFDYKGAATDILTDQWFPFTINLAGVTTVNSLTVGIAGGAGIVYVDDIRLYPLASELITPVQPATANLKALYNFAGNLNDGSGNGYNGTAIGGASVATDPVRGQVVSLNGLDQGVKIPLIGIVPEATIGLWINLSMDLPTGIVGSLFHDDGFEPNDIHWRVQNGTLNAGISGGLAGGIGKTPIVANVWTHVALTASQAGVSFWVNGIRDLSSTQATPVVNLGAGTLGAWLDTRTDPVGVLSRTFPGLLDEARFYDRVLTPAELAGLAGRTAPLYKPF
jgi:hypothetical protein